MLTFRKTILFAASSVVLFLCIPACNRNQPPTFTDAEVREQSAAAPQNESLVQPGQGKTDSETDIFSSLAVKPGAMDSIKRFVRTAEMRFRVKNVANATLHIEDIAAKQGGFVVKSELSTTIENRQIQAMNKDSALETTAFSVHNSLIIRVPYKQLDTTLRSIGRLCEFLDYRRINAEDVKLQLLEQELERIRQSGYRQELESMPAAPAKPAAAADNAERKLRSRTASDQASIETMKLEDAIRFSTIRLEVYQAPLLNRAMVANTDYEPVKRSILGRSIEALRSGGDILEALFLGIINLWGLILIGVALFLLWRRFGKKGK